eukprot:gb/GEZN01004625.1/.p1 GENE.gb/GEZN01004625.1/~~gb/GEZN01004625.1/.p1  ORF type:complete len:362 (-),score=33.51 gb/GEZN01004625.1/:568-1653(-)
MAVIFWTKSLYLMLPSPFKSACLIRSSSCSFVSSEHSCSIISFSSAAGTIPVLSRSNTLKASIIISGSCGETSFAIIDRKLSKVSASLPPACWIIPEISSVVGLIPKERITVATSAAFICPVASLFMIRNASWNSDNCSSLKLALASFVPSAAIALFFFFFLRVDGRMCEVLSGGKRNVDSHLLLQPPDKTSHIRPSTLKKKKKKSAMAAEGKKEAKANFSEEQLSEFQEAFRIMNKEATGQINAAEVATVMRSFGINPTTEEISGMIQQAGGSDALTFDNFLSIMAKDVSPQDPEIIIDAFKVFDRDNTGIVPAAELKLIIEQECSLLTNEQLEDLIKQADLNGDGSIRYRDFVQNMTAM